MHGPPYVERQWRLPPALRHRNFRLFLASQGVSLVGMQMLRLAQIWLVLTITQSPLLAGLVTAIQGLSVITLALPGGVIADRFAKRRILLATQSGVMIVALGLGILTVAQIVQVWEVVVLVVVVGSASALTLPARQAFVVEIVGPQDLGSAVGLFAALYYAAAFAGPALGGLAIAGLTTLTGSAVIASGATIMIGGVTAGSVVVGLLLIREADLYRTDRGGHGRQREPMLEEVLGGFRYLRTARRVLVTMLVPGFIAVLAVNFDVLVPVFGREMGLAASGVGLLLSAIAVGSFGAATWIGVAGASGPGVLIGGAFLLGLASLLLGLIAVPAAWPFLLLAAGLGASAMRTAASTQIQLATPEAVRGRVMGVFALVFEGISPLGGLIAGGIAGAGGARLAFAVGGAAAVILLALGFRGIRARS